MNNIIYYLGALSIGIIIAVQAGVNSSLRLAIGGSAIYTAFLSFLVGTIVLLILHLSMGGLWLGPQALSGINYWKFSGGLLGAFFVAATTIVAPKIGLANMLCLVVLGQLVTAILLDHFGGLGFSQISASMPRLGGLMLILGGVLLFNWRK